MFKVHGYIFVNTLLLVLSFFSINNVLANSAFTSLRDPTQPIGYQRTINKEKKMVLQAIFLGGGKKEAIINGSAVKEGGSVNGKLIIDIKPNQVTYRSDTGLRVLKLRQSIFNK